MVPATPQEIASALLKDIPDIYFAVEYALKIARMKGDNGQDYTRAAQILIENDK